MRLFLNKVDKHFESYFESISNKESKVFVFSWTQVEQSLEAHCVRKIPMQLSYYLVTEIWTPFTCRYLLPNLKKVVEENK